jgi:hypothetical protein
MSAVIHPTTRVPTVGLFRDDRHRYYIDGKGPYPGVTTVIKALDKPALIEWAKRETARCAIDNYEFVADLVKRGGPDAARAWLAGIPDFQRDTAANMGSAVHRLAEDISRGKPITFTDDERPFVDAYARFLDDYQPDFKSLERMVFSEKHGYGGTFDSIATIAGATYLIDTKTSKSVYEETAMQLAALANADFCGLPGDPKRYRIPKVAKYAVLHIRPDQYARGYRLIEFRVSDKDYDAFLACLRLTNWRKESKPIGESVPRSAIEAAGPPATEAA